MENSCYSKRFRVGLTLICCLVGYNGCCQYPVQPEPWTWRTFVVQDTKNLHLMPPPDKLQIQNEIAEIKQMMTKSNAEMLQRIAYWDSGAPAYRWNQIGYQLTGPAFLKNNGLTFFQAPMAWMNMAIYDATVAAWKLKQKKPGKRPFEIDASIKPVVQAPSTPSYPCEHAVTAGAAATVLAYFFPEMADSILTLGKQAAESRVYAGVQFPTDIAHGWKLGEQVATIVIEKSKNHLRTQPWSGKIPDDPKHWRGQYPVGAITTTFKPLILKSADQFRPGAPPDFAAEMEAMKNFKQNFYTVSQAYYWAAHSGLDVWTDLASAKIFEYHIDKNTPESARIYTVLHLAIYDCAIAIMDAKYAYFGIRPDQMDPAYKPVIGYTPPFPGYPSGHATASSAAATILSNFFPQDAPMFKQLAKECADSRFYAGIHFPSDNRVGLELGEKLGTYVFSKLK